MRRRGFTLVEILFVMSILVVMGLGVTAVLRSSDAMMGTESVDMALQAEGEHALNTIIQDLRQTGRVADYGGNTNADYPHLFTDGNASGNAYFAGYTHAPASQHVPPASPAFGTSTEMIFKILSDLDGDGKPTNASTGAIEWSDEDYGYRLATGADGGNKLWRQVDGVDNSLVATHVERLVLQDQAMDGTLGPNHVRITLWLAKEDPARPGYLTKRFFMSVINMRNVTGQGSVGT